jgi:pimeloyl-ACP methyl ester carboxylesterase
MDAHHQRSSSHYPTIVLVPGLWHGGWAWHKVEQELKKRGFPTMAVTFPGRDRAPGDPSFAGHCAHLRAELAAVEGPAVVVAHSYGGAVVTEAANPERVGAMVFVAAFALEPGESIADVVDGRATQDDAVAADSIDVSQGLLEVDRETAIAGFYHDCDPQEAEAAASRLTPEDPSTRTARVSTASWRRIPSEYVVCTDDRAITVERQRLLANRLDAYVDIDSGHSPMLCKADVLADIIERVAAKAHREA